MKKLFALVLVMILIVSMCSCNNAQTLNEDNQQSQSEGNQQTPIEDASADTENKLPVPDDFSFALTWGVYGISSYDSETGKLVKTSDTTNPDDYITYCQLSDEDMEYIYNLIVALDVYSYPEEYDPQAGFSQPWRTLILTVRVDDEEKTIKAEYVSDMMFSEDEKGQLFLDTCEAISNRLELTEDWMALPNYPTRYQ